MKKRTIRAPGDQDDKTAIGQSRGDEALTVEFVAHKSQSALERGIKAK